MTTALSKLAEIALEQFLRLVHPLLAAMMGTPTNHLANCKEHAINQGVIGQN